MPSIAVRITSLSLITQVSSRQLWFPTSTTQSRYSNAVSVPTPTVIALLPRQDPPPPLTNSATCGYTSGLWSSAVTCGEQSSCNYYTEPYSAPNFGCCSSGAGCGYVSTCVNYNASNNPHTGAGVYLQDEGFFCGSDAPFCSTLVLYGQEYTTSGTYSFLYYSCQVGSGTKVTAFQTTHSSSETPRQTTSSTSSEQSSSKQSSSEHTASEQPYTPSTTDLPANPSAATRETTVADASGGLSQGAFIGIGVGVGLTAAGALLAISLWFLRRRRQHVAVQDTASHVFYDGTKNGRGTPFGADHHGYSGDVLQKQGHEQSGLAELNSWTSPPVHHELDGNYTR